MMSKEISEEVDIVTKAVRLIVEKYGDDGALLALLCKVSEDIQIFFRSFCQCIVDYLRLLAVLSQLEIKAKFYQLSVTVLHGLWRKLCLAGFHTRFFCCREEM